MNILYISKNRLLNFIAKYQRFYNLNDKTEFGAILTVLKKSILRIFESIDQTRGAHVHRARYSDNDIEQISMLCLLEKSKDTEFSQFMSKLKKKAFLKTRLKWTSYCDSWIENIYRFLALAFGLIMDNVVVNSNIAIDRKRFG